MSGCENAGGLKPEGWGDWTIEKLDALRLYLAGFTRASSKKARQTLYLDLFAGTGDNESRRTGEPIDGSPLISLRTDPAFSKCVFCEQDRRRFDSLSSRISAEFPGRDVEMLHGDCNIEIPRYLDALAARDSSWTYSPVFAFVDQYTAEVSWQTIESLARFRRGRFKTELWLFFGDSFIPRGGYGDVDEPALPSFITRVTKMFGSEDWLTLRSQRVAHRISGAAYTSGLVNYMRWKLESELGYKRTIPLRVRNGSGRGIYTMIFATDNPAGDAIMTSVSKNAATAIAAMVDRQKAEQKEAKDRDRLRMDGLLSLDDSGFRHGSVATAEDEFAQLLLAPTRPEWL